MATNRADRKYKYDFKQIAAEISVMEAAKRLDLQLVRDGDGWRARCPMCQTEANPKRLGIRITPAENVFCCHAHPDKEGGDSVRLVAHYHGWSQLQAAKWLRGAATEPAPAKGPDEPEKSASVPGPRGMKPLENLVHDHPCLLTAGLSAEECRAFGIGFSERGANGLAGNIAFPVYRDGALAGYIGVPEITWRPKEWKA